MFLFLFLTDGGDQQRARLQKGGNLFRLDSFFDSRLRKFLVIFSGEGGGKRKVRIFRPDKFCRDDKILFRFERFNLFFPVDQYAQRGRLHPARGESSFDALAQERA